MHKITAYISKNILSKFKNNDEIKKAINYIDDIDVGERKRIDFTLDEKRYKKIKSIKKETGQPMWIIIENIFNQYLANKRLDNEQVDEEVEHIEPNSCPECGADSDELLIQYSDNTWYCHQCQASGEY